MEQKYTLSQGTRSEHFGDEVEGGVAGINPRRVKLDNGIMVKGAKQVNLGIEALQLLRGAEHVIQVALIPCYFPTKQLINSLIHRFHSPFPKHFMKLSKINSTIKRAFKIDT